MTDEKEKVIEEVGEWIDADVIADALAEEIDEAGETVTVERCKEVWLKALETGLHRFVREAM